MTSTTPAVILNFDRTSPWTKLPTFCNITLPIFRFSTTLHRILAVWHASRVNYTMQASLQLIRRVMLNTMGRSPPANRLQCGADHGSCQRCDWWVIMNHFAHRTRTSVKTTTLVPCSPRWQHQLPWYPRKIKASWISIRGSSCSLTLGGCTTCRLLPEYSRASTRRSGITPLTNRFVCTSPSRSSRLLHVMQAKLRRSRRR